MNAIRMVKNPLPVFEMTMTDLGDTYYFFMGGKNRGMITRDHRVILHMLQRNHSNYQKSAFQRDTLAYYIGYGLLTNEGDDWLRQRRLIQPSFHRKQVNMLTQLMSQEVDATLKQMVRPPHPTHINELCATITFRIIVKTIFSDDIDHEEIAVIRDRIERVQKMFILQIRQPYKRWFYELTGRIKRHKRLADGTREIMRGLIHKRLEQSIRKDDLLDFLVHSRYQDTGECMTEEQLIDELIILLVAGHETSSQSLFWTINLLCHHSDWRCRVLDEMDQKGQQYQDYFSSDSVLMACIKESMRLYPPAWIIDRKSMEEDEVGDIHLPKDLTILGWIYGLHRHPDLWTEANAFDPNRFLHKSEPKYYIPFGAGPRYCIGHHFALLEMIICLTHLLRHVSWPDLQSNMPGIHPLITLHPDREVYLDFR